MRVPRYPGAIQFYLTERRPLSTTEDKLPALILKRALQGCEDGSKECTIERAESVLMQMATTWTQVLVQGAIS